VLAAIDDFRGRRRVAQQFAADQSVINHDFSAPEQLDAPQGAQAGIAGAGADEIDNAWTWVLR
jgi:hypothetical protein